MLPCSTLYGHTPSSNFTVKPSLSFSFTTKPGHDGYRVVTVKFRNVSPVQFVAANGNARPWNTNVEPQPSIVTFFRPTSGNTTRFSPLWLFDGSSHIVWASAS